MTVRASDRVDVVQALAPIANRSTETAGDYISLRDHARILFQAEAGILAHGGTVVCKVKEAKDAAGTDAQDLTNVAATGTAGTNSKACQLTITNYSTIHDETFKLTQKVRGRSFEKELIAKDATAANVDRDAGEYSSDTGVNETAADLVLTINHLFKDLFASNVDALVTIRAREPGKATVSLADVATGMSFGNTLGTTVQFDVQASDLSDGFSHVSLRMNPSAGTDIAGVAVLTSGRYSPSQEVAAAKRDTSA